MEAAASRGRGVVHVVVEISGSVHMDSSTNFCVGGLKGGAGKLHEPILFLSMATKSDSGKIIG